MKRSSTKLLVLAGIITLSVLGAIIDGYATANGPWGYNDPVEYIATAHSLDAGQGLGYVQGHGRFSPIRIHPPFYSLVLAFPGLFKADLIAASRWLNIFAFAACIFIAGWIFYKYSRAPALGVITSALFLTFPYMLWMFSSAYSEPLFILLIMSGGLCLLAFLHWERKILFLASAILIGLIPATRYAGIAMVGAGALCILFFSFGKYGTRLWKAMLFGLISSTPVLIWLVWTYFTSAHSLGGRSVALDMRTLAAQFQTFRGLFIDTVGKWVPFMSSRLGLTYRLRYILAVAAVTLILGVSILAILRLRKRAPTPDRRSDLPIFAFFGLSSILFVIVLLLTYLFTHPTIDIDNRMLLPLFACSVMTLFAAFGLWQSAWSGEGKLVMMKDAVTKGWRSAVTRATWSQGWKWFFRILAWVVAVLCLVWYLPQARNMVLFYHNGDGLTAYHWGHSEIIQAVKALPSRQPIISNDWQLLLLWTGRPIYGVWVSLPTKPIQSSPYGSLSADTAQAVFCSKGGALAILNDFSTQFHSNITGATDTQLEGLFSGLKLYGTYPEGTIYLCP